MSAIISDCGKYRYVLRRDPDLLADRAPALFVMLNPSKADAEQDDPTIRRCKNFAKLWGCAGLIVVNLYAFRATDPKELWKAEDPVGPENDFHLSNQLFAGDVVCAWGNNAREDRVLEFLELANKAGSRLWHLGLTKAGQPRHPLFVRADQPLIRWNEREATP